MKPTNTNGITEPEIWNGIRKDAGRLAASNTAAAALQQALEKNNSHSARVLGFRLDFRDQVKP